MAASIEERIVAMAFENQVFEQRISQTLTSLGKLDTAVKNVSGTEGLDNLEKAGNKVTLKGPLSALDKLREKLGRSGQGADQGLGEIEKAGNKVTLEGPNKALDKTQAKMDQLSAGKTFSDIEKASQQVELSGITKAVDSVSSKFGMLETAASVAIGNITSQAVMKGGAFAKSFAFGPLTQGLEEYQTNMNSIQTIMANTEGQQVSGLDAVNQHLDELNTYADQTKYSFSEMAKNIGTFTAAGVDLPKATASIKGIANLAAISGSNSQQASTAMYQLSQAISAGKVGLQDWNSVVNAGMGGAVFQKALMRTAENMGALEKGAVKIDKATGKATVNGDSFRNSIMAKPGQESWLTSDVLTDTLAQLTGDMTKAELVAKGYSEEQAKAIMKQADTAKKAATEVKTLPEVWDVARESIGSGWAKTFQLIFGDFEESKKLFTDMSTFINGWIGKVSDARNELFAGWKLGGGRDELIEGLKQAFENIMAPLKMIRGAFKNIFPAKTSEDLINLTKSFSDLMKRLEPSEQTLGMVYNAFRGLFALLDIGWNVVKGVAGVIADLLGVVGKGSGGFAEMIGGISRFIVAVRDALVDGELLEKFFDGLSSVLQKPVEWLGKLAGYIRDLFSGGEKTTGLQEQAGKMIVVLTPLEKVIITVKDAWNKLVEGFDRAKQALEPWFTNFVNMISGLGEKIGNALSSLNFDDVMKGVQTGLLAGLLLMIKDLFGKGGGLMEELTNTLGGVQELLGGVTGSLDTMQKKVQAQLILAIAAAVIALAGGVYILSTIDGDKLAKAMTAVAVGLGELMGALKLMSAGMGKTGMLMLPFIAAGLIGVAIAVTILAGALKIFGSMSLAEIGKGLLGMAGALDVIAASMRLMPKTLVVQAAGLVILSVALGAIAAAIKVLGGMKWEELGKGLYAVISVLGTLAMTMSQMPPNMVINAAAIVVLSFALLTLSGAIRAMGSMDLGTLVKGIAGVMGALAALAVGMLPFVILGPSLIPASAGLFIVSSALVVLGKAMEIIGGIKILDLVKGLTAIGVALIELAVGMYLMIGTLPGSVAMLAAAAALAVLAPTLGLLGTMKWSTIFKGLAAIALVLGTIAVVGLAAAPALAALGIALIPLGLGFMLVAGAAKIFASAMALLSESGQKGVAAFMVALTGFIALIPGLVISFIKGLLSIVEEVAKIAPKVIEAIGKILEMVIKFVQDNAVKLAMAIGLLVDGIIIVLVENIPKLVQAGYKLLQGVLDGISKNIGSVTTKVAEIMKKFMDSFRAKAPSLIDAGAKLLKTILDGVGSKFGEVAESVGDLIAKFQEAIGNQAYKLVTGAAKMMGAFIAALATYGPTLLLKGAEVISNFIKGVGEKGPELIKQGTAAARKILTGIADGLVEMADIAFDGLIKFLNGLADTIRNNDDKLIDAGINLGDAIFDGMVKAFSRGGRLVKKALEAVFNLMPTWVKKILKIKSPSKVFHEIGMYTMAGFQKGISEGTIKSKYVMVEVGKQAAAGISQGLEDRRERDKIIKATESLGYGMAGRMRAILGIRSPSEVFREIGMNVNRGFRNGLLGSKEDVISAFEELNSSLIDKIRDLRGQVEEGNTRLEDLHKQHAEKLAEIAKERGEKKPDQEAIADMVKESQDLEKQINDEAAAVDQNGRALTRSREIRKSLTGSMHDEKMQLLGLKKEYEEVSKQLEEATQTLEDAIRARDDAQQKYTDQYNTKPDVDSLVDAAIADQDLTYAEREEKRKKAAEEAEKRRKIDQVALYKQALQEQLIATQKYQATLQKLRDLGLDDETYKKLLEKGTAGQEFANQLLSGGAAGIAQIKAMNEQMLAQSTELAKQAAANLYQEGVNAATEVIKGTTDGLKKGLEQRKAEIEAAMESLADMMVRAIKSKLKIKSPSQVFTELGKFTTQGLARGLEDTKEVEGAVVKLGQTMTDKLAAAVGDSNMSPVITPVLDLTQFNKDASGMGIDNVIPITAAASYGMGTAAAQEVSTTQQAAAEAVVDQRPSVTFEQNNYSPESLNDVEIYRKTKNQIGQLKSALGVPA